MCPVPNKEIGEKAIELVKEHERKKGRTHQRLIENKMVGYDLETSNGGLDFRKIEVKGAEHGLVFKGFVIEENQQKNFGDPNFWLYRVLKVFSDKPIILEIRPDEINLSQPQPRFNATSWKDKSKQRNYGEEL